MSGKFLLCLWTFIIQFTLMEIYSFRSVTCNRCNVFSPHKCWTYTNQTFCTLSFNRKLIKFCSGNISKLRGPFCFIFAWTSPWILNSRHTSAQASHGQSTHLLQGATLISTLKYLDIQRIIHGCAGIGILSSSAESIERAKRYYFHVMFCLFYRY